MIENVIAVCKKWLGKIENISSFITDHYRFVIIYTKYSPLYSSIGSVIDK